MAGQLITASLLKKAGVAVPLITKIAATFQKEDIWKIEWTSPNYARKQISILWGFLEWEAERGERKTFIMKGKPGFLQLCVENLASQGNIANVTKSFILD